MKARSRHGQAVDGAARVRVQQTSVCAKAGQAAIQVPDRAHRLRLPPGLVLNDSLIAVDLLDHDVGTIVALGLASAQHRHEAYDQTGDWALSFGMLGTDSC